jgi:hypothetical protein
MSSRSCGLETARVFSCARCGMVVRCVLLSHEPGIAEKNVVHRCELLVWSSLVRSAEQAHDNLIHFWPILQMTDLAGQVLGKFSGRSCRRQLLCYAEPMFMSKDIADPSS